MIEEGDHAPEFALPGSPPDGDGSEIETYSLAEATDRGPAVLNFYLFDFHPACTENVCDLHNLAWFDLADDVTVFGVSTDRTFSHGAFADAEDLGFALLSDSDGSVAESYGVLYEEFGGHHRIAKRSAFVVDQAGVVRYAWSTDEPTVQPDWSAVELAVKRARVPAAR